jgi:hypothetical protein
MPDHSNSWRSASLENVAGDRRGITGYAGIFRISVMFAER